MNPDLEKLDKDAHTHLYRMFCMSWISTTGGVYLIPISRDRRILDQILAYGKISPAEAQEIEAQMREEIPELMEYLYSLDENCLCLETRH